MGRVIRRACGPSRHVVALLWKSGRVKLAALWFACDRIDRVGFDAFDVVLEYVVQGCSSCTYTRFLIKLLNGATVA